MSGGGSTPESLEHTPTWAVAAVCFVLVVTSIFVEYLIHLIGKWLKKKDKKALKESLEKIKSELMLLGFISLLLSAGEGLILKICVPESVANSMHPCSKEKEENDEKDSDDDPSQNRRLLFSISSSEHSLRQVLTEADETSKCPKGKVRFISSDGLHQLHIFIFILAVSHVLYCIFTLALGRLKMRKWKKWEKETRTMEYQFSNDPERFRFARDTTFGRRHLSLLSKNPLVIWIVCFARQFVRSVPKVDYLTLRHGFILAHLAPESQTKFDFQKYINRSLEEDFKTVVGISPPIWLLAVWFILSNTHGWYSYLWLPFIPLIVILVVGTKLQVIITRMGLKIHERNGRVIKGVPVVEPSDNLFWFNCPRLLLHLINIVFFQNAFLLAFFFWTWVEFGFKSCFHRDIKDIAIRVAMGLLIHLLCSYVTLPLYALVTQMGSTMRPTVFNDRVANAVKNWYKSAKRKLELRQAGNSSSSNFPVPGGMSTSVSLSPVHLLHNYSNMGSPCTSLSEKTENTSWEITNASSGPLSRHFQHGGSDPKRSYELQAYGKGDCAIGVDISSKDFSFDKRVNR